MVYSLVKSANAQLQNAQLNFCKAQDIISCTKASVTSVRNDARFDSVWSGIFSATGAKDVIDDPELSRPRKLPQQLDESSNAFFQAETKDNYRQLYYEVLDSVISGLSDHFKPDATAVHLQIKKIFSLANVKILSILLALTKTMLTGRN